ncbi:MAG: phosphoribosylformylglycinamidine synthase subunit PurS [Phormidesmis sp.]
MAQSLKANTQTEVSGNLYRAKVYVTLRPSVLDPAGTAVRSGLSHMGYDNVSKVRIGKYIELELTAESEATAQQQLDKICHQLLANPVIETYRIDVFAAAEADV